MSLSRNCEAKTAVTEYFVLKNTTNMISNIHECTLGNAVVFQMMCISDYVNPTPSNTDTSKLIHLYFRLKNKTDKTRLVCVSSKTLMMYRHFTVDAASLNWHMAHNKLHAVNEPLKFDITLSFVHGDAVVELRRRLLTLSGDQNGDVELTGTDGKVCIHSCLLKAASQVLRAALTGPWSEARNRRLPVPNTSVSTLHLFKEFLYLGYIEAEPAAVAGLLPLASLYLMPTLARECAALLGDVLMPGALESLVNFDPDDNKAHQHIAMVSSLIASLEEIRENAKPESDGEVKPESSPGSISGSASGSAAE